MESELVCLWVSSRLDDCGCFANIDFLPVGLPSFVFYLISMHIWLTDPAERTILLKPLEDKDTNTENTGKHSTLTIKTL